MATFLIWCVNQPSRFSDQKYKYYCPVNVFIEYILFDVLLKLRDNLGFDAECAASIGFPCGPCEEMLDED